MVEIAVRMIKKYLVPAFVLGVLLVFTAFAALGQEASLVSEGTADAITAPEEFSTGIVGMHSGNPDDDIAFAPIVVRFNDGVTVAHFMATLQEGGPAAVLPLVTLLGGLDVAPESSNGAIYTTFMAVVNEVDEVVNMPEADVEVTLHDFAFSVPLEIESGPHTWAFQNQGTQWHEMGLIRLSEGAGVEQAVQLMMSGADDASTGESQEAQLFEITFFWAPMMPDERAWTELDLEPGRYVLVSFSTDIETGQSHLKHGMVKAITVN